MLVRDDHGERVCSLAGRRAVLGDRVLWRKARGHGGVLAEVEERATVLRRMDMRGREQVLAANLEGVLIVVTPDQPPLMPHLVDRYVVAASADGLDAVLVLNKTDLGTTDEVEAELAARTAHGLELVRTSAHTGEGLDTLREVLAGARGPWALVGLSGVGKTSLIRSLLPEQDVGPVGDISEYWGTGRHTTTHSRLFALPGGGEIADSPGIRGFVPALTGEEAVRLHFPGARSLRCQFRDCLHRPGEEGCVAEAELSPRLLSSYRRLLKDVGEARSPDY